MLQTCYCYYDMSYKASKDDGGYLIAKDIAGIFHGKGIKLIALDFDRTLVSVHTKGAWREGSSVLSQHVRPCFKAFMKAVLDVGLYLCIVTYSTQPDLIRDVLRKFLSKSDVAKITIRASTRDWKREQGLYSMLLGKQQHITCVITELYNKEHVIIQPKEIVLFDDDDENVKVALEFGHHGLVVTDNISLDIIHEWVRVMA